MTSTPAQRKAAERERRAAAGLVRLELWAHPDDHATIKETAAKLQRRRELDARRAAAAENRAKKP